MRGFQLREDKDPDQLPGIGFDSRTAFKVPPCAKKRTNPQLPERAQLRAKRALGQAQTQQMQLVDSAATGQGAVTLPADFVAEAGLFLSELRI